MGDLEGDWGAGRRFSDRGLEVSPLNPQLLVPRILLEYQTWESSQGKVYLERLIETMRRAGPNQSIASGRTSLAIIAIARISGVPDRLEIAEAAAKAVLSERSATPNRANFPKVGLALLAKSAKFSSRMSDEDWKETFPSQLTARSPAASAKTNSGTGLPIALFPGRSGWEMACCLLISSATGNWTS